MKSRSKFYLTPDDILDNETVEMRQKKSSSGDSELGQSGKFVATSFHIETIKKWIVMSN